MTHTADVLGDTRDRVGESPVWSVAEQALYWVDIEGRSIRRHASRTGLTRSFATPERVGCIALRRGGGLVAAMESGVSVVTLPLQGEADDAAARFDPIARAHHGAPGMRFNDGRCDAAGRLWVGSMCMDMGLASTAGALYRLAAEGRGHGGADQPVLEGLVVSNGLAFSPDRRTMYLSDSHPSVQTIWRFAFDLDSGNISERQVFVDMKQHPGRPDGAAVDEEGCYWSCANDAGLIHRFTPQGRLDRSVAVPVSKPSMCAFGGADLRMLFITSIRPASAAASHPQELPLAGAVFMLDVGVGGLEEPTFG